MEICLLLILITISGVFADSIRPNKDTVMIRREGESVTLSCTYDTSSSYVYLYWYRQYPNTEPQYLLWKGARSNGGEHKIEQRFRPATSQTSTELTIDSVTLSDSALYYCALRVAAQ
uniref:Ig-like domain-containing protein n=1 Tax=Sinocyclocheilus rhinocerous TaxID=307959 RepID=A0A673J6K1_9TELE